MRFLSRPTLFLALTLALPGAQATILHFDELQGSAMLQTYGGLSWHGWMYVDQQPAPFHAASGNMRLTSLSNDNAFTSSQAFTFQGAHFAGFATVNFELFHQGALVAVSHHLATSDNPTFLASGYQGLVDRVSIVADLPQFFVMDNVAINGGGGADVPEPGSLGLLIGALGVMAALGTAPRNVTRKSG